MSESVLENIRRDIRRRTETDRVISPAWLIVPIAVLLVFLFVIVAAVLTAILLPFRFFPDGFRPGVFPGPGPFLGILALVGFGFVAVFIVGVIFVYLLYLLIKRRNDHFVRQHHLFEDLAAYLRGFATTKGMNVELPLSNVERAARDARSEETEKSAALWVILSLVTGIAALYVYYFLTKDFFKHERREDNLIEDTNRVLSLLGLETLSRRVSPMPERNFVLYLILSIVTLGIFAIYWSYTLIVDPNNHFKNHEMIENELLSKFSH